MVKKRLIFTLLYSDGYFMLSRNFRLQRAGNIDWLLKNYNFSKIAFSIDELVILDVSREKRDLKKFCDHIETIGRGCFIPIAAGGGIRSTEYAKAIMQSGADKLVLNTTLFRDPSLVRELIGTYGSQCIIASVDIKKAGQTLEAFIDNGFTKIESSVKEYIECITNLGIGELYINSMDSDGTGHGYLINLLENISITVKVPIIMAGGAGNWHHLREGLQHERVDAVATANLFNFIGQGFPNARKELLDSKINLAKWNLCNTVM